MEKTYFNPTHPTAYTGNVKEMEITYPMAQKWLSAQPTYITSIGEEKIQDAKVLYIND